ncbi:MAG: hypothetical protein AAGI68_16295 [Planctomycetota bacterium]
MPIPLFPSRSPLSRTALATTGALFLAVAVGCQTTPESDPPATQAATQPAEETGWTPPPRPEPRKTILERQSDKISRSIRRGRY